MVHALLECWRVLQPGGTLIDLRPVSSNPPLELIIGNEILRPGAINDEGGIPDDVASDAAMAETVRRGAFSRESLGTFPFYYYWDSLEDLLAYAAERWHDFAHVPAPVAEQARQYVAGTQEPCKARLRRKMQLGVYKKTAP